MKLNKDKSVSLVSGHKHENVWVKMEDEKIWDSAKQKLLGIEIGRNLNFDDHIISLCKKAGRKLYKNHLQERSLRIVYNDYTTSFEDLLKKDNSFKIHHKKIQSLAIELFKVEKGIANPILCDIFLLRSID